MAISPELIAKNRFAFAGIALVVAAVIVLTFLSLQRPAGVEQPRGVEKVLRVNGVQTVLFEGVGCGCSPDFQPVCGADGRNYYNECFAQCADVSFTEGACPGSQATDACRPAGTSGEGEPCGEITPQHNLQCQPGLVCIDGRCKQPTGDLPGQSEQCGAVIYDEQTGTGYWDPTACSAGLSCQGGLCYPPASCSPSTSFQPRCAERDGGDNPATEGPTSILLQNGTVETHTDTCEAISVFDTGRNQNITSYYLTEWYCVSQTSASNKPYSCTSCSEGVCQGARPT